MKVILLGVVVIGLVALLTTELLIAFGVNNTFILLTFGTIIPILLGAVIILKVLDVI